MERRDSIYYWFVFLLNPFIAVVLSLKRIREPIAMNIFWAFCVFYGFTFTIGAESAGSDINRYILELQNLYSQEDYTISEVVYDYQLSKEVDVLKTFLLYFISRFTNSQELLTLVFAFIFGFFYSRNIWYVFGLLKGKISFLEKVLLLALILVVPIWLINGFRMWTAFHVFMYGLLPFIFERKKHKFLFLFLSFFVHFSFVVPITVFLIYFFLGNRINIFFGFFIISIFITNINVNSLNQIIETYVPQSIDKRSSSYRSEQTVEARLDNLENNTKNWYVKWHRKLLSISLSIMLIYLFIYARDKLNNTPELKRLFSITLLFYSISNILMNLPSGGRYLSIAFFLSLLLAVLYLNYFKNEFKFRKLITYLSPAFILFIIVAVRMGFYNTSIITVFGNPIVALFDADDNMSLNDLIK